MTTMAAVAPTFVAAIVTTVMVALSPRITRAWPAVWASIVGKDHFAILGITHLSAFEANGTGAIALAPRPAVGNPTRCMTLPVVFAPPRPVRSLRPWPTRAETSIQSDTVLIIVVVARACVVVGTHAPGCHFCLGSPFMGAGHLRSPGLLRPIRARRRLRRWDFTDNTRCTIGSSLEHLTDPLKPATKTRRRAPEGSEQPIGQAACSTLGPFGT